MDGLRLKLEGQGLENVTYMVVNHQGEQAQHLHTLLSQKLSENIILYKQVPKQDDVWQALAGKKDDFLIYDRSAPDCGLSVCLRSVFSEIQTVLIMLSVPLTIILLSLSSLSVSHPDVVV